MSINPFKSRAQKGMRTRLRFRLASLRRRQDPLYFLWLKAEQTEINCVQDIWMLNERTGRPMIIYTLRESGSSAEHPSFYPDTVNKIPKECDANDLLTFL
jgi:hypothetical protein